MLKSFLRKLFFTTAPLLFTSPAIAQDAEVVPRQSKEDAAKADAIDSLKPVKAAKKASKHADPALWVVKDNDTTVYLFGTVHILKPGLSWFDDAVKDAFQKSDTLVLEIVEPPAEKAQKIFGDKAIDKSGKTLRSKMTDADRAIYDGAMTKLGMPVESLDPFDPWAAAVTLQVVAMQKKNFDVNSGVEKQLASAANASNKPIKAVETIEYQLGLFDKLPQADQVKFLVETVKSLDDIEGSMDKLIDLWAEPDPEGLGDLMNEGLQSPELYSTLITKRNANWAKWIKERMGKPGTVFMAVGAGHLGGPVSVQHLLTAYGIKAERVSY